MPELEVLADAEAAARRGAELIAAEARRALSERGRVSLAVSGGKTPWRMLALLADSELPWTSVALFQVDERIAPAGSPDRNLTHMIAALSLDAQASIRPMPVNDPDPAAGARRYEEALPQMLDVVHLGLGPDGHTASLVPGDAVLEVSDRRVALTAGAYQGRRRMTLTYPALEGAARIVWLISGEDKRSALERLMRGDRSIPAGRVRAERSLVIADRAAAGELLPK